MSTEFPSTSTITLLHYFTTQRTTGTTLCANRRTKTTSTSSDLETAFLTGQTMDQAARGAAALKASNFEEAIKLYTSAIASNPNAVDYYIKRSTAHQRSSPPDYQAALSDAEIAAVLAFKRAKRELIKDSQLRRAIALFFLERYADAEYVFSVVKKLDDKEKTLTIWNKKVADKMAILGEDDERRKVSVKEIPDVEVPSAGALKNTANTNQGSLSTSSTSTSAPKPVVPTPPNKIKHDWYQNSENVYFTLLAKGVPKDKATIEIDKHSVSHHPMNYHRV